MGEWFCGVDFGQRNDRTAVCVLEKVARPDEAGRALKPFLDVRHLQRLPIGQGYPDQVAWLTAFLSEHEVLRRARLVVDATGVGVAVVDLLRDSLRRGFTALTITSGNEPTKDGDRVGVPKRDLVSRVAVALQSRRLRVAPDLGDAKELLRELEQFGVTITDTGRDTYGARNGHDDLVMAVSYAVWQAECGGSSPSDWARLYAHRQAVAPAQPHPEPVPVLTLATVREQALRERRRGSWFG
jgi:hypothetical protein